MSMGNYLTVLSVILGVMAASNQTVAVDHPTVVPENFDPETEDCSVCESSPCECR
ncbi:hypothetical protein SAMN05216226_10963 [Halovenus aranensis]|jgi:hypothetical protein|uniref:Uncharacterized protein n=1 Tax=Halovenus aranensis TaxID=890420 RepID=A0A1G8WKE3_9EURY|nr:hypothetical protein SAMN05216226_10963 [Halovenus aranensis]